MENLFIEMAESIVEGDDVLAKELAEKAISMEINPMEILDKGFFKGMQEVGEKFENSEMWLPDIMVSAEAMEAAMDVLKPELVKLNDGSTIGGKIVLGTVRGDVHDIGKNIVKTMLIANGFEVYDLGKDVPVAAFIEKAIDTKADIIAMSALMTSTMLHMPDVVESLKELNIRDQYKVIVGGAPVLPKWAAEIGTDGSTENAIECVALCKKMIKEAK